MSAAERLPELMTEAEAASYLGVAEVTLRRIRKREKIGYIRIGSKPKYTESHLLKFLEQQTCQPASASATTGSNSEKDRASGSGRGATRQDASSALRLAQETLTRQKSH
ncbi:helix-turn-helix domain-containing protein [Pseudoxanthomonas sp. USHLN014]|uniref:helix-turn-helix domain-containing protein n=1 Tax=Pseudoxanthomonas sp. USHLN014 TaxID=3081297 RepID=UPI00301C2112